MKKAIVSVVLEVLLCLPAVAQEKLIEQESSTRAILFRHVNVFTGMDTVLLTNRDVWIEDGRIKTIGQNLATENDTTVQVIEAHGKTLMPGLVDAHVHLSGSGGVPWAKSRVDQAYNLSAYLYAGITTVYDLGGMSKSLERLAKKVAEGKLSGPAIYHAHIPISVKNSHPIPLSEQVLPWPLRSLVNSLSPTIDDPEEAEKLVRQYIKQEVDYVKIVCDAIPPGSPEMSPAQLNALVQAAHDHGKKALVHIGSPENAMAAIQAGADALAHGVWRGKLTEEQADAIADSGIPVIYTLAGFQNVGHIHTGEFHPVTMDSVLIPGSVLTPVTGDRGTQVHDQPVMAEFFADVAHNAPHWQHNFSMLHKRGVKILVGTDSNLPGTYAGATYYQELHALHEFGMSNAAVLQAATYGNAHLFLTEPDFGSIEEGKAADLLLLNGDPTQDLGLLEQPELILKSGRRVQRMVP